jgi:two-component system response regulator DesR
MEAGASGFLLKDARPRSLPTRSAAWPPAARRRSGARLDALAEGRTRSRSREREVLATRSRAATIAEMASRLSLSEGTVRNHLSAAIQKVGRAQPGRGGADRRGEGLARSRRRSLIARPHEARADFGTPA